MFEPFAREIYSSVRTETGVASCLGLGEEFTELRADLSALTPFSQPLSCYADKICPPEAPPFPAEND